MAAAYQVQENVAVIEIDNPPVNGLGYETRRQLLEGLQQAWADPAIQAIIVASAGKAFSGGADIREFNTPKALQEPILTSVIRELEDSPKPVIAAIHGVAMGGGLELALGCHYRLAVSTAVIALPEVRLGLMPGAGGTQRLPRAIGVERALAMILSGDAVAVTEFANTPLFDVVTEGDLREAAMAFANKVAIPAAQSGVLPRLRDRDVDQEGVAQVLEQARAQLAAQPTLLPAPAMCIDAVAAAAREPIEHGLRRERELFLALLDTRESRALRYAFMSERAAAKLEGAPASPPRSLKTVAVIGETARGLDFAQTIAAAGFEVLWLDLAGTELGAPVEPARGSLTQVRSYAELAEADLVIATSPPGMDADMPMFEDLDEIMKDGAILAADAATTDIDSVASTTARKHDVIALHGCRTSFGIAVLEIGRGKHTATDTVVTMLAFAKKLRLPAVVCEGRHSMIGERMRRRYWRHIELLQEEGVTVARISRALGAFGYESPGAGAPIEDADDQASHPITEALIVERLVCALVNEAAHILHEGVAQRASDIDLVCLKAHGFPVHMGGPLCYAHELGLDCVVAAMMRHGENAHYECQDWIPAPLLVRLANEGRRFD